MPLCEGLHYWSGISGSAIFFYGTFQLLVMGHGAFSSGRAVISSIQIFLPLWFGVLCDPRERVCLASSDWNAPLYHEDSSALLPTSSHIEVLEAVTLFKHLLVL